MYLFLTCSICVLFFILFLTHIAQEEDQKPHLAFVCFRWFYYIAFVITILYTSHIGGGIKEFAQTFGNTCLYMSVLFIAGLAGISGGGLIDNSNKQNGDLDYLKYDYTDYVPQKCVAGNWYDVGSGYTNLNAAISRMEQYKQYVRNNNQVKVPCRVAERRNGKVVGTAYS